MNYPAASCRVLTQPDPVLLAVIPGSTRNLGISLDSRFRGNDKRGKPLGIYAEGLKNRPRMA